MPSSSPQLARSQDNTNFPTLMTAVKDRGGDDGTMTSGRDAAGHRPLPRAAWTRRGQQGRHVCRRGELYELATHPGQPMPKLLRSLQKLEKVQ
jgi:hypothetical protein